jgi:dihydrodipicolinate synthase/N-acetylneuraminate lyase
MKAQHPPAGGRRALVRPGAHGGGRLRRLLRGGTVIPAHPLALTAARRLDERRQRALTRYYLDAGAGGIAVGVHTTQFGIRSPRVGLFRPVLELAARTVDEWEAGRRRRVVRVAGIIGPTRQAVAEAEIAAGLGYQLGLLGLGAMARATDRELIVHARRVGEVIPLMGFYLQPAVGGRRLSYDFWRRFVELPSVVAIKIAPFNRYDTLDVVRAVADAGQAGRIALYTGNDDSIVADLLTGYPGGVRMVGGLLGHWAFWTRQAVRLHARLRRISIARGPIPPALLRLGAEITDANGAIFDAANRFRGCIPGIHEILRRQGLLAGRWCLDPEEELSPGQAREIDRVCRAYPHLVDDPFVRERLDGWMR